MVHLAFVFWGLVGFPCIEFVFESLNATLSRAGLLGQFNMDLAWLIYGYLTLMTLLLLLTFWYNYGIFPAHRRVWESSFMCRRCGHILQLPEPSDPAREALIREAQS
ncbi:MAG: hypothetical protein ACRD2P_05320 [Terriglobia bacterium]